MGCYMKNEAKQIVKTANLLCNFLVSVSLAPEQNICMFFLPCLSGVQIAPVWKHYASIVNCFFVLYCCTVFLVIISKKTRLSKKKCPKFVAGYFVPHISTPRRVRRDIINLCSSTYKVSDFINWNKSKDLINNSQYKI